MTYPLRTADGVVNLRRVTEVIRSGMPKPALCEWELREAVKFTLHHFVKGPDDDERAKRILSMFRSTRRHAERGTEVHKIIAAALRGTWEPARNEHLPYLRAFSHWLEDSGRGRPVVWVEQTLWDAEGIAGTVDAVFSTGLLVDWKTTEKLPEVPRVWPDHLAQLGAYASMTRCLSRRTARGLYYDGGPCPTVTEAAVVTLDSTGAYCEARLSKEELEDAKALWLHVKAVAEAVGR